MRGPFRYLGDVIDRKITEAQTCPGCGCNADQWRADCDTPPPLPTYLVDDIADRAAYDALPWRVRLTTTPPAGLPGRWVARVGAWCATRIRRRTEKETT